MDSNHAGCLHHSRQVELMAENAPDAQRPMAHRVAVRMQFLQPVVVRIERIGKGSDLGSALFAVCPAHFGRGGLEPG